MDDGRWGLCCSSELLARSPTDIEYIFLTLSGRLGSGFVTVGDDVSILEVCQTCIIQSQKIRRNTRKSGVRILRSVGIARTTRMASATEMYRRVLKGR